MTRFTPLWEAAGSYPAALDRRLLGALYPVAGVSGCAVTVVSSSMNMNIAAGTVAAPTVNNTGSVLCYSDAVEVVTSPTAPAAGTDRYDLVVCQPRGNDLDGGSNNDFVFTVVSGTASSTPAVPAVPAGAVPLAQIRVIGGSAALSSGNLVDRRPPLLVAPNNEPFAQTLTLLGGTIATTELWLGTIFVPPLPFLHRVRFIAQCDFSCPSTGTIDMRVRANLTGAVITLTDPVIRRCFITCAAGNQTLTCSGVVDVAAGVSSAFGVLALTSGMTVTTSTDPTLAQLDVRAIPI